MNRSSTTRLASFLFFALILVTVATSSPSLAAAKKVDPVNSQRGAAIEGYDPVAYFQEAKPVKGSKEHSLEWRGATWLFSSAENRDAFEADPERWAPQYGGYCAYAVSKGSTASIDPDAFTVRDGKLYLNNSLGVQKTWRAAAEELIPKADENWPRLHR